MSTTQFWSRFTHTAGVPLRLMVIVSMLISALMLPMGTVSAVSSNRVMCENDASLVGCWRMEEGSGTSFQDGGGEIPPNVNDGTLTHSTVWGTGNNSNYALLLNQGTTTNQYGRVLNQASLNISGNITLAAWIKTTVTTNTTQYIIKKSNGSTGNSAGYELSLASTGKVFFRFFSAGNVINRVDSSDNYPLTSTWIHVAGTFDGATMRIYINGIEKGTLATTNPIGVNALNLGIGSQPDGTTSNFKGQIDDVRIYNRALNATEIGQLFNGTSPFNGDTTAPDAPTGLNAIPGDTTVSLTWDNLALPHDVKGWNVYRSETSPVDTGTPLDYVTTESYNDIGLDNGTTYYYTIKAVDTSDYLSDPATETSATPFGNVAPIVTDIPDQTITEGDSFATIILDDYVSDVDNTDEEMIWTYTGESELTVSIVDRVATITPPDADWNGSETITFRATDPGALWDEDAASLYSHRGERRTGMRGCDPHHPGRHTRRDRSFLH